MGLLDDLTAAAGSLDPSLQPTSNQIGPLLGALVQYQEHGDKFLKAAEAGPDEVSKLIAGDEGADTGKAASADSADTGKAAPAESSSKKDKGAG